MRELDFAIDPTPLSEVDVDAFYQHDCTQSEEGMIISPKGAKGPDVRFYSCYNRSRLRT